MASPVVAGAVALLASTVPEAHRWELLNPASMKQVRLERSAAHAQAFVTPHLLRHCVRHCSWCG